MLTKTFGQLYSNRTFVFERSTTQTLFYGLFNSNIVTVNKQGVLRSSPVWDLNNTLLHSTHLIKLGENATQFHNNAEDRLVSD